MSQPAASVLGDVENFTESLSTTFDTCYTWSYDALSIPLRRVIPSAPRRRCDDALRLHATNRSVLSAAVCSWEPHASAIATPPARRRPQRGRLSVPTKKGWNVRLWALCKPGPPKSPFEFPIGYALKTASNSSFHLPCWLNRRSL